MLELSELRAGYGKANILWDVELEVGDEEIVALVGSNGAGKSTLLRTISGTLLCLGSGAAFGACHGRRVALTDRGRSSDLFAAPREAVVLRARQDVNRSRVVNQTVCQLRARLPNAGVVGNIPPDMPVPAAGDSGDRTGGTR